MDAFILWYRYYYYYHYYHYHHYHHYRKNILVGRLCSPIGDVQKGHYACIEIQKIYISRHYVALSAYVSQRAWCLIFMQFTWLPVQRSHTTENAIDWLQFYCKMCRRC